MYKIGSKYNANIDLIQNKKVPTQYKTQMYLPSTKHK